MTDVGVWCGIPVGSRGTDWWVLINCKLYIFTIQVFTVLWLKIIDIYVRWYLVEYTGKNCDWLMKREDRGFRKKCIFLFSPYV